LETLAKLADLLKLAGNVPTLFVVNKAPTQGTEGTHAVEFMRAQGYKVCPVVLYLRAAHRHATNVGQIASEYEADSKAAQELLQLYKYTIRFVDSERKKYAKTKPALARA
jgi:chromosome partitioning protein